MHRMTLRRKNTEEQLHKAVAKYLAAGLGPGSWFTTFPAGGGGKIRGGKLKAMGLKPGVPDVLIIHQGRAYWIELKAEGGRLNDKQKALHPLLSEVGCCVAVCRSLEDVEESLREWGIPSAANLTPEDWARRVV